MNTTTKRRVAAVQIEADLGNVDHNLEACERQVDRAASAGATWIALPEFFSTGVAYRTDLSVTAAPVDGEPTKLLRDLARRHGVHIGGSTLVRDADGHVRNAFLLAAPDGELIGRHDKDLPTMWENALYVGGTDPGRIRAGELTVGIALCWELIRAQTVARLADQVDLVLGGSGWWSIPRWPFMGGAEVRNRRRATTAPATFARHVGAPVVHAAHAGAFTCRFPLLPVTYRGHCEGGAQICDAFGKVLDFKARADGDAFAIADVHAVRSPGSPVSDRFWLQRRGTVAALVWAYQNAHGRRVYNGLPIPEVARVSAVMA
ncbi:carbon-nitrogen hydrolase family protein [Mycolicibacterium sp. P1-5]|uniref:carbon-nitrogen hydrolase family protein n=1 Tax=Mycolicibacterium sp. P1-5 TaxID=2024617 RepID=UPI0011ED2944|nr:carbon-nitrogen hydrolase family protein [Mycolicibacterium sp. P1-5]KAA0110799.1 carbon-nitrogen hydrolase family protein [Mycolicibacterium sp. P1-5]